MPLTITIPEREFYDEKTGRFITTKKTTVIMEHSLLSISKWESKWHKPYLTKEKKTEEESLDYLRCMCISKDGREVNPNIFRALTPKQSKEIADYISDPMTGTTIRRRENMPQSREMITNELVYFWMSNFGIPFDPCEKWHFNRLMTLIEIASIKNNPDKKKRGDFGRSQAQERAALNASRRAQHHSRG